MTTSTEPVDGALERRVATFLRAEAPAVAPPGLLAGALGRLDTPPPAPAGRTRFGGLLARPSGSVVGLMAAFVVVAVAGVIALGGGRAWRPGPGAARAPAASPPTSASGSRRRASTSTPTVSTFTLDPASARSDSDPGDATLPHSRVDLAAARRRDAAQPVLRQRRCHVVGRGAACPRRHGREPSGSAVPGPLFERPLGDDVRRPVELTAARPDRRRDSSSTDSPCCRRSRPARRVLAGTFVSDGDGRPCHGARRVRPGSPQLHRRRGDRRARARALRASRAYDLADVPPRRVDSVQPEGWQPRPEPRARGRHVGPSGRSSSWPARPPSRRRPPGRRPTRPSAPARAQPRAAPGARRSAPDDDVDEAAAAGVDDPVGRLARRGRRPPSGGRGRSPRPRPRRGRRPPRPGRGPCR